jgi:hypothetical protein
MNLLLRFLLMRATTALVSYRWPKQLALRQAFKGLKRTALFEPCEGRAVRLLGKRNSRARLLRCGGQAQPVGVVTARPRTIKTHRLEACATCPLRRHQETQQLRKRPGFHERRRRRARYPHPYGPGTKAASTEARAKSRAERRGKKRGPLRVAFLGRGVVRHGSREKQRQERPARVARARPSPSAGIFRAEALRSRLATQNPA